MSASDLAGSLAETIQQARHMDGPLTERLALTASALRRFNPEAAGVVDRMADRLRHGGAGRSAPKPGQIMPPFVLPDDTGRLLSLQEVLANGPVVISFNRGHWCPFCRLNVLALTEAAPTIAKTGGQIIAITPERRKFSTAMKTEAQVRFPILTDMDNGYALSLNLAIWVGQEMQQLMSSGGRDLPRYQGNDAWMLPIPAVFVVGTDGRIRARFLDPDYRKRMEIIDILDALIPGASVSDSPGESLLGCSVIP